MLSMLLAAAAYAADDDAALALAAEYARVVDKRLEVPADQRRAYADRLRTALSDAGIGEFEPQFFLLVDRSPAVQAVFVYWLSAAGASRFVGASPVSTGHAGGYEYFITPLGVFEHTPANMDFRAEGTRNAYGIRGYGIRGMRVFDFGWVEGERTWDTRGRSPMRLQMHATDPDFLENQLGRPRSKGCIRIPATLNVFIDHRGLLDAEYERAVQQGRHLWVLRPDRQPVASQGKYLVIVDSQRKVRPPWSPLPSLRVRNSAK
jgi:hypothetical protein